MLHYKFFSCFQVGYSLCASVCEVERISAPIIKICMKCLLGNRQLLAISLILLKYLMSGLNDMALNHQLKQF